MNKPTKPQIVAIIMPILTLAAGYFGYQPIQELKEPQGVEVHVDAPVGIPQHSHPAPPQKDWLPVIKQEIEKAKIEHSNLHH